MSHSWSRYGKGRRDESEPEIVEEFLDAGATVVKHASKDEGDLIVGYRGVDHWVECKSGNKQPSEGQKRWAERWRGRKPELCRNADQARKLVRLWDEAAALELRKHNALQASTPDAESPAQEDHAGKDLTRGAA